MIVIMSIGLIACGGDPINEEDFVVPITMDFDSIAPNVDVSANTKAVLRNMHDAIYGYNKDNLELELSLAESVNYEDDGKTIIIKLKEGLNFHNGQSITADDVVYSLSRLGGYTADQEDVIDNTWERLLNPEDPQGPGSIVALDDLTVELVLAESYRDSYYSTLEYRLADAFIIPEGLSKEDMEKHPIGAGPYKFVDYFVSDHITFTAFEDYHGEEPEIKNVDFKIFGDENAKYLAFQSGEVDWLQLTPATYDEIKSMENIEVVEGLSQDVRQIWLNQREDSPFSDIRLRKALNYAIDKQRVLDIANGGRGITLDTHLSSENPAYNNNLQNTYEVDKERARELLAEAGYPNGFETTYAVVSENQLSMDIATVVQEELAQVGIIAEIKAMPWAEFYPNVYQNYNYEMAQLQIVAYPDAYRMLSRFMDEGSNVVGSSNPRFDEIIRLAAAEKDVKKQKDYYMEAQQVLVDDATNVFILDQGVQVALSEGYTGYKTYPFAFTDISSISYK